MNSTSERTHLAAANPESAGPAVHSECRDIQATLDQVREMLHKQEIVESLVSRQHVHRQDLVEYLQGAPVFTIPPMMYEQLQTGVLDLTIKWN